MKRRFIAKKKRKSHWFWLLVLVITFILINNQYVKKLSAGYIVNDQNDFNIFDMEINREKLLLLLGLNYRDNIKAPKPSQSVFNEIELSKPQIYVYNSHQTEEYVGGDVLKAAKLLETALAKLNVDVIVEETNIAAALKKDNLAYKDSYKITRNLLNAKMNDSIALYIDLHRDSGAKNTTTIKIGEKSYARLMFVIGAKHDTYQENYRFADELNNLIKNYNENLTRGIFIRKSSSYNQDLKNNIILIELGGPYNTMEEVSNTIDVLADVLAYYLGE